MQARLVQCSNPNQEYSDEVLAEDRFQLTELGYQVTETQTLVCTCAGHITLAAMNNIRVSAATSPMCKNCTGNATLSSTRELDAKPSCSYCANYHSQLTEHQRLT